MKRPIVLVIAVAIGGCGPANFGLKNALDNFNRVGSCAKEQIVARQVQLTRADFRERPPPPEVAADPTRLAIWSQADGRKVSDYDDLSAVSLRGCGREQVYLCHRNSVGDWNYACDPVDLKEAEVSLALGAVPLTDKGHAALPSRLAAAPPIRP